jgi:uncharacterized glyoxalase superfamily protein PhnB
MRLNPHLQFDGQCEAAFKFYEQCLGGKIVMMMTYGESPVGEQMQTECRKRILHTTLAVGNYLLQGADVHPENYQDRKGFPSCSILKMRQRRKVSSTACRRTERCKCPCRRRSGRCALACSLTNSKRHGRSIADNRGEARATQDFVRRVRPMNLAAVGCPSRQNIDSLAVPTLSVRVPIRMRRPPATLETLRLSPLVQARWEHAARLERVPFIPAGAKPFVLFGWRPPAKRQRMRWCRGSSRLQGRGLER